MGHLSYEQRYTIGEMKANGFSSAEISKVIGKDKSVLSRELKRNSCPETGEYRGERAHINYQIRQSQKTKKQHFTTKIRKETEAGLRSYFSPEQISGTAKKEGRPCVSAERIYQHVWANKKAGGDLYTYLRTKGKKYRARGDSKDKRGQLTNRIGIENRPEIVEKRSRFGDLEVDTIMGKNNQGAIVTINDRASGALKMKKTSTKGAEEVMRAILELLAEWKPFLYTITSDNGKEFARHEQIAAALGIDFYFARPYHSWERGSNENLNGLIRQFIPKKTDFNELSDQYIQQVEDILNNRPRKRFDYKTPLEQAQTYFSNPVAFTT